MMTPAGHQGALPDNHPLAEQGVGEGGIIASYTQYVGGKVQTFRVFTIKRPPVYSSSQSQPSHRTHILSLSVYKRIN